MKSTEKRVLLTGAAGFIGRHTIDPLVHRGFEVHGLLYGDEAAPEGAVTWHQGDLLNSEFVPAFLEKVRPTHLLGFAWYVEHGKFFTSLENFRWVQAYIQLLLLFHQRGGKRVVVAGSCAEYDWNDSVLSEYETPLASSSQYGTAKQSLYLMYESMRQEMDLSGAWGRIFFVYGPHEHPQRLVSSVIQAMLKNRPARCSHGKQERDFLHVQDVADAFVALLDSEVQGPVNIASGAATPLKEIIEGIGQKLGKCDLIKLGAIPVGENDPALIAADVTRLNHEVKWKPKFDLDRGLDHTIEWWKQHLSRGEI